MNRILLQLAASFFGTYGFCLIFRLRKKWRPAACLIGMAGWGVYLAGMHWWQNIFPATLAASAFCAVCAETLARLCRVPATVLFIPSVIPLIPGRALYYALSNAVSGDISAAQMDFEITVIYALAIAIGMSIVWAFWYVVRKMLENGRNPRCRRDTGREEGGR